MQTLETLPYIVRSARAIIGKDKPYRIGPSTIGMRQNPYGSRVMDNPGNCRITMTGHDPRQGSLFAAAWMIGYVAATAETQLEALTLGALTGSLGLASAGATGELVHHPVFHTACGLADLGGRLRYRCHSSQPGSVAAVAGKSRDGRRAVWLANLTEQPQTVMLVGNTPIESIDLLDEESFPLPLAVSVGETGTGHAPSVKLRPYAVACLRLDAGKQVATP